eukprot:766055-Hanusia_phi.AAC.5
MRESVTGGCHRVNGRQLGWEGENAEGDDCGEPGGEEGVQGASPAEPEEVRSEEVCAARDGIDVPGVQHGGMPSSGLPPRRACVQGLRTLRGEGPA